MLERSAFTHVASIYTNVLEQKKAFKLYKIRVHLPED